MGRNRAEAGTTDALVLLNQRCFVPWQPAASSLPRLYPCVFISLPLTPFITPFSVSTLWSSAQSPPLEVSRPRRVNTPAGDSLFKEGTAVGM